MRRCKTVLKILNKIKGPVDKSPAKRRKIHMKTKVLSDAGYLSELKKFEEEKEKKAKTRIAKQSKKKKKDEDESEIEEETEEEVMVEESSEDESMESESEDSVTDEEYLRALWKSLRPPTKENEILQKWFGVVYTNKKKSYLYSGKATKRFLEDENGLVSAIEIDCLKPHVGNEPILESIPAHLPRDLYMCPLHNIIFGPLVVSPPKGEKWHIPTYHTLKEQFEDIVKIDREKLVSDLE